MASIWNFEPTEAQMKIAEKKWGAGQKLKLEKEILVKAGVNLCPKVKKAVFFGLSSMDQCGVKYRSEASGNHLFKTVLDAIKEHKGKIKDVDDIQDLLREMCNKLIDIESDKNNDQFSKGSEHEEFKKEEFENLEKFLKGTSVMGKIKGKVVPKALRKKKEKSREDLKTYITSGVVAKRINEYFNLRKGPLDGLMQGFKEKIDALRSKKSKNDVFDLVKDIKVERIKSPDEARELIRDAYLAINDRLRMERDALRKFVAENGERIKGFFDAYKEDLKSLPSGGQEQLKILNECMGNGTSSDVPSEIDIKAIEEHNGDQHWGKAFDKLTGVLKYIDSHWVGMQDMVDEKHEREQKEKEEKERIEKEKIEKEQSEREELQTIIENNKGKVESYFSGFNGPGDDFFTFSGAQEPLEKINELMGKSPSDWPVNLDYKARKKILDNEKYTYKEKLEKFKDIIKIIDPGS